MGLAHMQLGQNEEALHAYQQSLEAAEGLKDSYGAGNALIQISTLHWRMSQYAQALHTYEAASCGQH